MKDNIKWSKLTNWFIVKPKLTAFIVFLIFSILFTYIAFQKYHIEKENKRIEMINTLKVLHQNIEQSLKNCYTTTLTLALTINDDGIPEDFDLIGEQLLQSNPSIEAVQLDPKGIIRYIYPMKGNEAALGLNILESENLKKEAYKSIISQKMYFAGPLNLKQGGQGIVGRLPVYLNNEFWGFSAVIIKLDKLLKTARVNSIDRSKYYFQISKKNPITQKEVYFLPQKVKMTSHNYVLSTIPDGEWKLYLIDKESNNLESFLSISITFGIVLAFTFSMLTFLFLRKPAELQFLVEKQAAKLINSEIKFKTIFDQAAIGIANVDPATGKFLEINNKFCTLLGYTQKEMKEKTFQSITFPDDLETDLKNVKKMENGIINQYSMEKRYITKEGKIIWVNLNVTPLLNQNNNQISAISIVEDITFRKENEELIKKSENHFKSLFDDSPLPLREEDFSKVKLFLEELDLMNKDPKIVKEYLTKNQEITNKIHSLIELINVNKACLKLYRVDTKEELLRVKSSLFNTTSFNDFIDQIIAITQNKKIVKLETVVKDSQGKYRYIHLLWNVIIGYENSLERIIVFNEDVTERKTAEITILNSQKRIESLINTIDGIVWECDAITFEFTFISKKVEHILGYSANEWLSSTTFWMDHIHPDDKDAVLQFCTDQTRQGLDHDFEYRMIAKNGTIVWLRDIVNIIIKNGKPVSLRGIMIDITKTKEIETELNKSFDLVSEQNKRLLNFSYIVSHNLRSHTSNISSLTGLIETADNEEERDEMIHLLKTASNSLNETLANLYEVVNIQTNIGLVTEDLNLKEYIDNTITVLDGKIREKDAQIISSVGEDVIINYNPAYLESILFNIISNAIRYSHKDRKPVISIKYSNENNKKIIEISDNGIGIDLEKNGNKVFGMYKTFSNNPDSKGIGLFITKNQIDAMGGSITIASTPGEGTTFKIRVS